MRYFAWAAHGSEPAFVGPVNPHSGKRSQAGSLSALTQQEFNALVAVLIGGAI